MLITRPTIPSWRWWWWWYSAVIITCNDFSGFILGFSKLTHTQSQFLRFMIFAWYIIDLLHNLLKPFYFHGWLESSINSHLAPVHLWPLQPVQSHLLIYQFVFSLNCTNNILFDILSWARIKYFAWHVEFTIFY